MLDGHIHGYHGGQAVRIGIYQRHSGGIAQIDSVQALPFLERISAEVITFLPIVVGGLGQAAPCPEIASQQDVCLSGGFQDPGEDIAVDGIAAAGGSFAAERETIPGIAELFDDHFLAEAAGSFEMAVDITPDLGYGLLRSIRNVIFLHPTPVIRPYVDGDVIDVRAVIQTLEDRHILLAAHLAFVAGADHMLFVYTFDKRRAVLNISDECIVSGGISGERTRLIADLPGIDGIRILVALHHIADVPVIQFHGLRILREPRHG